MTHLIAKDHERTQRQPALPEQIDTGEVVIATGAYKRAQRALASVDEYGAGVAHQDLSEAVLRYSGATLLVLSESLPTPASLSAPQGDKKAGTQANHLGHPRCETFYESRQLSAARKGISCRTVDGDTVTGTLASAHRDEAIHRQGNIPTVPGLLPTRAANSRKEKAYEYD